MKKPNRFFLAMLAPMALFAFAVNAHAQTASNVVCNGCVDTSDIDSQAVTTGRIRARAVTTTKLADNAVITSKIKDGVVTRTKLAAKSVTSAKLQNASVGTLKIKDGAVTADKLADSVADQLGEVTSGIEFGAVSGSITGTASTIASVTVTAPGPGYVRVSVNSYTSLNFSTGASAGVDCTINTAETNVNSGDALPESRDFEWLHSGMPSGFYYKSLGSAGVHTIGSAGTYTYYMRCVRRGTATWGIDNGDGSMQAMYFAERL